MKQLHLCRMKPVLSKPQNLDQTFRNVIWFPTKHSEDTRFWLPGNWQRCVLRAFAEPHHSHFLTLCWPWKDKVATLEPILWKMVRKFTPRRSNLKSKSQFLLYSGNLAWKCQFQFWSRLLLFPYLIQLPVLLLLFNQCHYFSVVLKEQPLQVGFDLSVPPWFLLKVLLQCSG